MTSGLGKGFPMVFQGVSGPDKNWFGKASKVSHFLVVSQFDQAPTAPFGHLGSYWYPSKLSPPPPLHFGFFRAELDVIELGLCSSMWKTQVNFRGARHIGWDKLNRGGGEG